MATRFCVTCGTEVDEQATFCPACGNPMDAPPAATAAEEIPPAPAWPRRRRSEQRGEPDAAADDEAAQDEADEPLPTAGDDETRISPDSELSSDEPEEIEPEPMRRESARLGPIGTPASAPTPASVGGREPRGSQEAAGASAPEMRRPSAASQLDIPVTWPVMLSGWLIGIGSFVGALAVLLDFRAFTNPVTLIAFLLLLAVAATVFFSANVPAIPHRRLWVMVIVLVAFGAAFERVGAGTYFAGLVFFLGTGAATVGAIILELGLDRPFGGPRD
jgi:hypothetical protein